MICMYGLHKKFQEKIENFLPLGGNAPAPHQSFPLT